MVGVYYVVLYSSVVLNWFSPLTTAVPCLCAALLIVNVQTIDVHDAFYGMCSLFLGISAVYVR